MKTSRSTGRRIAGDEYVPKAGQVIIGEEGNTVMQYNFKTIYEKDVIHSNNEQLEHHIRTERDTFVTTSIYEVPRSDYIHPLYGLRY